MFEGYQYVEMARIAEQLDVRDVEMQGPGLTSGFLVLVAGQRRKNGACLKHTGSDLKCGQIHCIMARDLQREIQGVMYNGQLEKRSNYFKKEL